MKISEETKIKIRSILWRFIKGGLAGAGSTLAGITIMVKTTSWVDIVTNLNVLAIAFVSGFIGGIVLAFVKYVTWKE